MTITIPGIQCIPEKNFWDRIILLPTVSHQKVNDHGSPLFSFLCISKEVLHHSSYTTDRHLLGSYSFFFSLFLLIQSEKSRLEKLNTHRTYTIFLWWLISRSPFSILCVFFLLKMSCLLWFFLNFLVAQICCPRYSQHPTVEPHICR